jgi:hypothetical protein
MSPFAREVSEVIDDLVLLASRGAIGARTWVKRAGQRGANDPDSDG